MNEPEDERALLDPPLRETGRGERIARLLFWPLQLILVAVVLVAYVLYTPLRVDGDSMQPNLHDADRLLYTKSYEEPTRGDVVIVEDGQGDLLKRVVAIGGDTVEIRDDIAFVNGVPEQNARIVLARGSGVTLHPITVPQGHVFVLGDNRPISYDSRIMGTVPLERIKGKAVFVFAPINRVRLID